MRIWIAIWTGSSQITEALAAWLAKQPVLRTATVFAAVLFTKGLPWTWRIVYVVAAAWLVTAIVLGLRLPDPTAPAEQPDEAHKAPAEASEEPSPDTPAHTGAILRGELAVALHEVAAPHAHITALAEHLNTSTDLVRLALTEAGIPISGGVRMKGRPVAVSPGVKRDDFPPLPSPAREQPQKEVLTSNNNDNNNDFQTVPDDVNPARTHIHWRSR